VELLAGRQVLDLVRLGEALRLFGRMLELVEADGVDFDGGGRGSELHRGAGLEARRLRHGVRRLVVLRVGLPAELGRVERGLVGHPRHERERA
jgi:hypothetical protein